jgi:putative ABC transport system permease protein
VTDGALEALGERLVRGRLFTAADNGDSMPVTLINETMAALYWPGEDPIGRRVRQGGGGPAAWTTIVGIVGDLRHNGVDAPIKGKFYRPYSQFFAGTGSVQRSGALLVKSTGDPAALSTAVRSVVRELDRAIPVATIRTMDEVVATAMSSPRLTSSVLVVFAAVALVLAAIGIYSLLAYVVAERSYELGIRVAIGASGGHIVKLIVRQGVLLALTGTVAGSLAAAAATRVLAAQLHEVSPLDPVTFVVTPLLLLGVAGAASLLPAWRASRVNPVTALR